ncbi:hypothetical protein KFL_009110010, partial [Klebsormidium nitens]
MAPDQQRQDAPLLALRAAFQTVCHNHILEARGLLSGSAPSNQARWSETETLVHYERSLSEIVAIADRATTAENVSGRKRVFDELSNFLTKNAYGVSVETASPADIATFIHSEYIPKHKGESRTVIPNSGEHVLSASAVKNAISHISRSYTLMGFDGAANPGRSELVKSYRDGYTVLLHDAGVREKRAKVFSEQKLDRLLAFLSEGVARSSGLEQCNLLMDRAAFLYLWESRARGKECRELLHRQVERGEGVALPGWSKTVRQEPSARIPLSAPESSVRLSFLEASAQLIVALKQLGYDLEENGCLFR